MASREESEYLPPSMIYTDHCGVLLPTRSQRPKLKDGNQALRAGFASARLIGFNCRSP